MTQQQQTGYEISKEENYKMFYDTIKMLAQSQGMYGRILRDIDNADIESVEELKQSLPTFYEPLDVIMWIEQ